MNAQDIVQKMLEAGPPVDPDDPAAFIRSYQSAWERAGFELEAVEKSGSPLPAWHSGAEEGEHFAQYEKYIWREGIFSVEVTHELGGPATGPRQFGNEGGWEIYAFINNVPNGPEGTQSAYARKTAKTEEKALATAMAAKLVKLGFTGWRNHWHKAPITVTLKPSKHGGYANIHLRMDYVPNDAAIKALTTLNKFVDKVYPDR